MSSCLKGEDAGTSDKQKAQQGKMKSCNKDAADKKLKGDETRDYRRSAFETSLMNFLRSSPLSFFVSGVLVAGFHFSLLCFLLVGGARVLALQARRLMISCAHRPSCQWPCRCTPSLRSCLSFLFCCRLFLGFLGCGYGFLIVRLSYLAPTPAATCEHEAKCCDQFFHCSLPSIWLIGHLHRTAGRIFRPGPGT